VKKVLDSTEFLSRKERKWHRPRPRSVKARFEAFELDASPGELSKAGILVKLQPQPFRALLLLVERAGCEDVMVIADAAKRSC
jgi:hypothetical protein